MEKILNNGLILPQSGYEITSKEEMSYEEGGWVAEAACIVGLVSKLVLVCDALFNWRLPAWARWSIWGLSVVCDVVGALSLAKHMTTYSLKGALHKIVPAAYKTASKLNDVCKALDCSFNI